MNTNDKQTNTDNKNRKVKMPHMFQKSNQEPKLVSDNLDLFPEHEQNLSKIVRSYQSYQDFKVQVKTNTLVTNAKNLLETQTNEEIKSLYEYLDQLKTKFVQEKEPNVDDKTENEDEISDSIITTEASDDQVNINDLLLKTEKEIISTQDQKTLLKSLIDDINLNSSNKNSYDDSQFEHNMTEIINETIEEDEIVDEIEEFSTDEPSEKPVVQNNKLSGILIIILIIVLVIMGYVYKDIFLEFFQKIF